MADKYAKNVRENGPKFMSKLPYAGARFMTKVPFLCLNAQ